jgi:hypothetical protein
MASRKIIGDNKSVILFIEENNFLKVKSEQNANRKSLLTINEAEAYSIELINKWASEKLI